MGRDILTSRWAQWGKTTKFRVTLAKHGDWDENNILHVSETREKGTGKLLPRRNDMCLRAREVQPDTDIIQWVRALKHRYLTNKSRAY